ncbi:hypothetical protein ACOGYQ_001511 [Edwardsiella piscicida]|uniref:hypothetical protein n=1 Tax=Edwardsiella piscicida TaxID=1263550 RepID=UPI000ABD5EFD|nr:hypothetical protein [Edwardsiella piscicida]EKS7766409.1 hypothetical protein [Edwardsiella piscicida]EKS7793095.1 hypothetical protein [Edwardsiella piscicida]ELM3730006.1 hypothetical protein [Edwardsiella piscicida]ELV7534894.1 hypothetical protein [Edwardsiella piscicida]UBU79898.1 hypothetical protein A9797_18380 [Edwardsiella piscicida]
MFRKCTRHAGSTPAALTVRRQRRLMTARAQRERWRDRLAFSRIVRRRRGLFSL